MNSRAKTSALVFGLIGGSINAFIASILSIILFTLISQLSDYSSYGYDPTPQLLILAAVIIVCLLNFIGALTCIRRRIVGGVLMLITGILLFITLILALSSEANSYGYMLGFNATIIISFVSVYMIVEVLPIIGAVLCFFPPANPYQPYGQPYAQPYGQPQQPYGQPYQPQQPYGQPYQPQQPNKTE